MQFNFDEDVFNQNYPLVCKKWKEKEMTPMEMNRNGWNGKERKGKEMKVISFGWHMKEMKLKWKFSCVYNNHIAL